MRTTRAAFTLVELLVAAAITGVLVGIFLPAIQQVREAGRRTACSDRSRQLALATHAYESAMKKYPSLDGLLFGADTPDEGDDDLVYRSFILKIAPYLESENQCQLMVQRAKDEFPSTVLADEINFDVPTKIPGLSIVRCPSMSNPLAIENFSAGYPVRCRLDYMPCEGYFDTTNFQDFRSGVNLAKRRSEIKDGTSNTLLYGESQGEVVNGQRQSSYGYAYVPWGLFVNWAYDIDYSFVRPNPYLNPFQDLDGNRRYSIEQFSSTHPQLVVFSLCDGSVQAMDRSVSPEVLISMSSTAFGETVPQFTN